jgi:hypothetical protein
MKILKPSAVSTRKRSEVLTAVRMLIVVFWVVAPCSLVDCTASQPRTPQWIYKFIQNKKY